MRQYTFVRHSDQTSLFELTTVCSILIEQLHNIPVIQPRGRATQLIDFSSRTDQQKEKKKKKAMDRQDRNACNSRRRFSFPRKTQIVETNGSTDPFGNQNRSWRFLIKFHLFAGVRAGGPWPPGIYSTTIRFLRVFIGLSRGDETPTRVRRDRFTTEKYLWKIDTNAKR